jgi:hypothetical protein
LPTLSPLFSSCFPPLFLTTIYLVC